MKNKEVKLLEDFCKAHNIKIKRVMGNTVFSFSTEEKDPFEGVKFVRAVKSNIAEDQYTKGKIYKVESFSRDEFGRVFNISTLVDDLGRTNNGWGANNFEPSSENAYTQQLIREAKKRFGEIKKGDRFERKDFSHYNSLGIVTSIRNSSPYYYAPEKDRLFINDLNLYEAGKWAKKLEGIKVEFSGISVSNQSVIYDFNISDPKLFGRAGSGDFLAKKLENYLNGEEGEDE